MKAIVFAAFTCLLAAGPTLHAQNPARGGGPPQQAPALGEIRGTVQDAEGKTPIVSASVAVWTKGNAALVAGTMTQQNGSFRIEGLPPGTYTVKVAMIGYDPH